MCSYGLSLMSVLRQVAVRSIPEFDGTIIATTGKRLTIRAECHPADAVAMSL